MPQKKSVPDLYFKSAVPVFLFIISYRRVSCSRPVPGIYVPEIYVPASPLQTVPQLTVLEVTVQEWAIAAPSFKTEPLERYLFHCSLSQTSCSTMSQAPFETPRLARNMASHHPTPTTTETTRYDLISGIRRGLHDKPNRLSQIYQDAVDTGSSAGGWTNHKPL